MYASRFMQSTLLAWFVLERTDSPWQVALVGFFGWSPLLVLGLVGGALADSLDRKRVLAVTLSINLTAALVLTALLTSGTAQVWHAYVAILVSGSADAVAMPSRRSLIHDIVGRVRVTNAVALDTMGMNVSGMLGPALAGGLITLTGVKGGYVAVVAFYVVALTCVLNLDAGRLRVSKSVGTGVAGALVGGARYVLGHRTLLATISITVIMNVTVTPYRLMVPVVARDVLRVAPGLMGILMSAHGLGALAGSFLVASRTNIRYHGRVYIAGSVLALAAILIFSTSRIYAASLLMAMVAGLGNAGFNTMQMSLTMLLAKNEMRGAALGALSLGVGGGPLGMLITGGVATAIGTTQAIGINAVFGLACLALIALLVPQFRQPTVPDAQR